MTRHALIAVAVSVSMLLFLLPSVSMLFSLKNYTESNKVEKKPESMEQKDATFAQSMVTPNSTAPRGDREETIQSEIEEPQEETMPDATKISQAPLPESIQPQETIVAQPVISTNSTAVNAVQELFPSELEASHHPRLWIYVSSWDEGMSSWLQSISQILAMTRKLNAIFVVPCVMKGRLYSCNNTDSDTLVQLGEFLDLSLMKEFYPRLVSYDQFQQEMIWQPPSVWTRTCMHMGNPPAAQLCKGASVSYMQSSNEQLETAAAASVNGNAVLEIIAYRKGAISKLQYRGVALLERNDYVAIKASYLRFNPKHYSYVDNLLKNMGVDKDSFSVIHWRAEKSNIDYLDCAQEIIKTRSLMENTVNVSKFVLMSSLNTNEDLMWTGARKMASNSTSKDALKLMLASGFQKLDTVIDSNALVDSGLLAVWDLIVATKATKFATCTRGCKKKMCQKCNHLGGFAVFALQLREVANKTSNSCWPE